MDSVIIQGKLGKGGFGDVYRGTFNGKPIAVKVMDLRGVQTKVKELAKKELAFLSELSHPNIVKCLGGTTVSNASKFEIHIYMELCDDGDLDRAISRMKVSKKFFPEKRIREWFLSIVKAVEYLHSKNIIHRDIKPHNLLLHKKCIKLGDFGLAKLLQSQKDFNASVLGTEMYACPEIMEKNICDTKGDMWSLGCTLFHFAVRDPPFNSFADVFRFKIDRSRLNAFPKRYSNFLKNLVDLLLQYESEKRPEASKVVELFDQQATDNNQNTVCHSAALASKKPLAPASSRQQAFVQPALVRQRLAVKPAGAPPRNLRIGRKPNEAFPKRLNEVVRSPVVASNRQKVDGNPAALAPGKPKAAPPAAAAVANRRPKVESPTEAAALHRPKAVIPAAAAPHKPKVVSPSAATVRKPKPVPPAAAAAAPHRPKVVPPVTAVPRKPKVASPAAGAPPRQKSVPFAAAAIPSVKQKAASVNDVRKIWL